jgi:hypothetical protein
MRHSGPSRAGARGSAMSAGPTFPRAPVAAALVPAEANVHKRT